MEDFPSNSHQQRETGKLIDAEPSKKIEKVITGEATRRKQSLSKRFLSTFVGGDPKMAASYVLWDILLPAAKDAVTDSFSQGIERILFGDSRSAGRRASSRTYRSGFTNYSGFAQNASPVRSSREDVRGGPSRRARAVHNFDEIVLATRVEAEEVIDRLFDLVNRYESATVADLYELVGISGEYTDDKWGWVDIRGAKVTRIRDGYLLDLPRPEPLD